MLELRTKWNSFSTILESDTRPCVSLLLYILGYIIKLNEVLFTNVMVFFTKFHKKKGCHGCLPNTLEVVFSACRKSPRKCGS